MDTSTPELSVVVVVVSDTVERHPDLTHLERCLGALAKQEQPPRMEIIVPHLPAAEILSLQRRFPAVRFVAVPSVKAYAGDAGGREHHDELRARGLALARGEVIGLLEDHGVAEPGWCRAAVDLQRSHPEFAAIGGTIGNAVDRPLNWAVYFCDFLRYQLPSPRANPCLPAMPT